MKRLMVASCCLLALLVMGVASADEASVRADGSAVAGVAERGEAAAGAGESEVAEEIQAAREVARAVVDAEPGWWVAPRYVALSPDSALLYLLRHDGGENGWEVVAVSLEGDPVIVGRRCVGSGIPAYDGSVGAPPFRGLFISGDGTRLYLPGRNDYVACHTIVLDAANLAHVGTFTWGKHEVVPGRTGEVLYALARARRTDRGPVTALVPVWPDDRGRIASEYDPDREGSEDPATMVEHNFMLPGWEPDCYPLWYSESGDVVQIPLTSAAAVKKENRLVNLRQFAYGAFSLAAGRFIGPAERDTLTSEVYGLEPFEASERFRALPAEGVMPGGKVAWVLTASHSLLMFSGEDLRLLVRLAKEEFGPGGGLLESSTRLSPNTRRWMHYRAYGPDAGKLVVGIARRRQRGPSPQQPTVRPAAVSVPSEWRMAHRWACAAPAGGRLFALGIEDYEGWASSGSGGRGQWQITAWDLTSGSMRAQRDVSGPEVESNCWQGVGIGPSGEWLVMEGGPKQPATFLEAEGLDPIGQLGDSALAKIVPLPDMQCLVIHHAIGPRRARDVQQQSYVELRQLAYDRGSGEIVEEGRWPVGDDLDGRYEFEPQPILWRADGMQVALPISMMWGRGFTAPFHYAFAVYDVAREQIVDVIDDFLTPGQYANPYSGTYCVHGPRALPTRARMPWSSLRWLETSEGGLQILAMDGERELLTLDREEQGNYGYAYVASQAWSTGGENWAMGGGSPGTTIRVRIR